MIGQTISHYQITEKIGGGGMGVVYKAEDLKLKRQVAIKFLPPDLMDNPDIKERFIHEAQAASALEHPNICTIHEIDEADDGQLFIVMACYDGASLKDKIQTKDVNQEEDVQIIVQVARGLAKAHEKGIIHRDIKPDNIMVTNDGLVKILDFGLAKLAGQTRLTRSGTSLGTAAYMSPEQARSEEVDHRSDIFSLGVVMYELFTGQLPFEGHHELAMMYSIVNEEPQLPKEVNPEISTEQETVILKAMEKDPDNRFQNMLEMESELLALQGESVTIPAQDKEVPAHKTHAKLKDVRQIQTSKIVKWVVSIFAVMILLTAAILLFKQLQQSKVEISERELAARHVELANLFLEQNKLDSAKVELGLALQNDSSSSAAWSALAAVNIRQNQLNQAINQTIKAIENDPENFHAAYNLAFALEDKDRLREAVDWYQKSVTINPAFIPGYSALGGVYIKLDKATEAILTLNRAIKNASDSTYLFLIYKNLGRARYLLGQYDEAKTSLNLSRKLQPNFPETIRYLAELYEATQQFEESRILWQRYLSIEQDSLKRAEAETHLQKIRD